MPQFARKLQKYGTTIFTEINQLAAQHQAINLGQGSPDFSPPDFLVEKAVEALRSGGIANQYAPGYGVPALREALVNHIGKYYNLDIDASKGVVVTSGASEGMFCAITSVVDPGDEVILIEPAFDIYKPAIEMASGIPVFVPLRPPEWTFDRDEMRKAFSDKTKAIVVNTPNNPTARVFTEEELTYIADLCKEFDVIAITDEVYEHLLFDDNKHIPMATLPDMFDRTITVSSAAKTFSVTGWKIGWVYGNLNLMEGVWRVHQNVTFAVNHTGQIAIADALQDTTTYFEEFHEMYERKKNIQVDGLRNAGLRVPDPQGTFYAMANFSEVFDGNDVEFTRYLIQEIGVACIPPSVFYSPEHKHIPEKYVRFTFCKNDQTLIDAGEKMKALRV